MGKMELPIQMSRERIHPALRKLIPNRSNPSGIDSTPRHPNDFDALVSAFKIGKVWKSSRIARQNGTDQLIAEYAKQRNIRSFLEVGAGSGVSSIDLMKRISNEYEAYYVSDKCPDVLMVRNGTCSYFYTMDSMECILRAGRWIIAHRPAKPSFGIFSLLATALIARAPQLKDRTDAVQVSLLNPRLREIAATDPRVQIMKYDVLDEWPGAPVDMIKIGNLLLQAYFDRDQLAAILNNVRGALKNSGLFVLVENVGAERTSIFELSTNGCFKLVERLNGGVAVESLILAATATHD